MSNDRVITECEMALRRLAEGAFEGWTGLPPQCGASDLAVTFSGGETEGSGFLSHRPAKFRVYQFPGQSEVIYAWFDENTHVMLITIVAPTIKGDVRTLLANLGPPETRLEQGVGNHADAHQWIYASRGMTLFVREHSNTIARVAVYPPTSVERYMERLGAQDKKRYWPTHREQL
jgi:hypothetical protein